MSAPLPKLAAALGSAAAAAMFFIPLVSAAPAADEHGYIDSAARCDSSQTLMAYGRTTRSLVVICVGSDGQLQYRGVRLSDGADLQMPAGKTTDGLIVANNDGVTYTVSPAMLLVSAGDNVLYRDSWTEFRQARFPGTPAATTVTTTTVTPTATPSTTKPAG